MMTNQFSSSSESQRLTISDQTPDQVQFNNGHIPSIKVVRAKYPRRYKLLPREKLRIPPNFGGTRRSWGRDYTKHMPLLALDDDDDDEYEEFDSTIFKKVSNKNLRDLMLHDKPIHVQPQTNDDLDDWDLTLVPPNEQRTRKCCSLCGCTIS